MKPQISKLQTLIKNKSENHQEQMLKDHQPTMPYRAEEGSELTELDGASDAAEFSRLPDLKHMRPPDIKDCSELGRLVTATGTWFSIFQAWDLRWQQ